MESTQLVFAAGSIPLQESAVNATEATRGTGKDSPRLVRRSHTRTRLTPARLRPYYLWYHRFARPPDV